MRAAADPPYPSTSLQGRKKEAEDYLRDQNELARRQSALYQYYLFQLNSNIAIVEQNLVRSHHPRHDLSDGDR